MNFSGAILLGAGISSLTTAYHLKKAGLSVLLLEKSSRWGGCLQSVLQNGFLLEKGPHSFLKSHETLLNHVEELHLGGEVIEAKREAKKRFILYQDRLHPLPKTPVEFLKTPILSSLGKIRFLMEPFMASSQKREEESVARFVQRRFGNQALRLVEPMIHGIYAGDPEKLSLSAVAPSLEKYEKEYGSLLKALRKVRLFPKGNTLFSFRNGMQTLSDALFRSVQDDLHLNCEILAVEKREEGWVVRWKQSGTVFEEKTRYLVFGLPAYEAAGLLQQSDETAASVLQNIPYAPLLIVHLVAERSSVGHPLDGFGFLVGKEASSFLLGSVWSSSVFDHRCEDSSKVLWTCFIGGAAHPEALRLSDQGLITKAEETMNKIFGGSLRLSGVWPTRLLRALPQYTLGHLERLKALHCRSSFLKGLYFVGNYLDGISVNDTMQTAVKVAGEIVLDHRN